MMVIIYLGHIVHDIEINIWEKKVMKETPKIEKIVSAIISSYYKEKIIEQCYQCFAEFEASELQPFIKQNTQ